MNDTPLPEAPVVARAAWQASIAIIGLGQLALLVGGAGVVPILVAILTVGAGVGVARFLPADLRAPVAKLWLRDAVWIQIPQLITIGCAIFVTGRFIGELTIVTTGLCAAIWLTRWAGPSGLRRYELGGVSFAGVVIVMLPLNVIASYWFVHAMQA